MGGDQLALGRSFAFKLLIVITDGYANTPSPGYSCADGANCDADLQAAVDHVYTKVPKEKLAIYAVGVGTDRDVSLPQLTIVAAGKADHVLRRNNFAELASINVELISRSCDQNTFPCGGCCGFCLCGKCQSPDSCDNPSPCTKATVPSSQVCCVTSPVSCVANDTADKCHTHACDDKPSSPTAGQCIINTTVQCGTPFNTTCFNRTCIRATGLCVTLPNPLCGTISECIPGNITSINTACDDKSRCTTKSCAPDGACQWASVNCSAVLPPTKCSDTICDPASGCQRKSFPSNFCDDGNNCTMEFCDDKRGCVYTNVTCDDNDPCTNNLCDRINGCQFVPKVCDLSNSSCRISFCNATTGECQFREEPCTFVFPQDVVIGATIGGAALIGIIVAAVICAAGLAGGGAYAVVQAQGGGGLSNLQSNPLYKGTGNAGNNPLYKN